MLSKIRIGTRSSKLALIQTNMVAEEITEHQPDVEIEIIHINTSGDWKPEHGEVRLSTLEGGKAQFAKEIEQAIAEDFIDIGVHSMKDMASFLPDGMIIDTFLPREDPRDAFLANDYKTLADLPDGAVVGTASLRRQSMILKQRPDLKVIPYRGNVPTRIEKLRNGQVDATILALSGLIRMGLEDEAASILSTEEMLPAACQGTVGIEHKEARDDLREILAPLNCPYTRIRSLAERAVLQAIDGSCHTPIGAYATLSDSGEITLTATILAPDGQNSFSHTESVAFQGDEDVIKLGTHIGQKLKQQAPSEWIQ